MKKLYGQRFLMLSVIMINVIAPVVSSGCEKVMKAKCAYSECNYIKCHYAVCHCPSGLDVKKVV